MSLEIPSTADPEVEKERWSQAWDALVRNPYYRAWMDRIAEHEAMIEKENARLSQSQQDRDQNAGRYDAYRDCRAMPERIKVQVRDLIAALERRRAEERLRAERESSNGEAQNPAPPTGASGRTREGLPY